MKIAYMTETYHPDINGTVTYIDSSVKYLKNLGHQVLICAPYTKGCEEIDQKLRDEKNFEIARFPSIKIDTFIDLKNKYITVPLWGNVTGKVNSALNDFQADIVHLQTDLWLSYAGWYWARENKVPCVMTAHTQMLTQWDAHISWLPRAFLKAILTFIFRPLYLGVDWLIAPASGMDNYLKENHNIDRPLSICLTGIDPTTFRQVDREQERLSSLYFEKYPRFKKRKRLLFAGRISPEKNIDFLLEMLQKLLELRQDVELILCGHSTIIDSYQEKAEKLGVSEHLTFLGAVEHSQMTKLYAIADLFTFASKSETQGLATTEAIYFGLPCVAVSALGTDTVLKGNKGGYLVEEDRVIFANKVNELLSDPQLYAQKRKEALSRHEELSFSHTVNCLLDIYTKVRQETNDKKDSSKGITSENLSLTI